MNKLIVAAAFFLTSLAAPADVPRKPSLVVFIVVDQLRGDWPLKLKERFGPGGFQYLFDHGLHFANAHYPYSNTVTAVGHASLATGATPVEHGSVSNEWWDAKKHALVYATGDAGHKLLGVDSPADAGTSPLNLLSTTIGDELVTGTGGRSRVFSVAMKDRASILIGGHLGKAFWFHNGSGGFVTSDFYYKQYPSWVTAYNNAKPTARYRNQAWTLLQPQEQYLFGKQDDRPFEKGFKELGRTFPHELNKLSDTDFNNGLHYVPFGDRITLDFAKTLIKEEKLGQTGATDMLLASLSVTDYVGHYYGPNSLEAEDNVLQLDATLADFFAFLEATLGLKNVLIVLSADHGSHENPMWMQDLGLMQDSGTAGDTGDFGNKALQREFNTTEKLVDLYNYPNVYLSMDAVKKLGLKVDDVENALATALLDDPDIALAVSRSNLMKGLVPDSMEGRKLQQSFHPKRSGDVLVIEEQLRYSTLSGNLVPGVHGAPYATDSYVPIFIAGPGIANGRIWRDVIPEDIAPTLAAYLNLAPPSGTIGTVLPEAMN